MSFMNILYAVLILGLLGVFFGAVLAVNAVVFFRRILPVYKRAFEE